MPVSFFIGLKMLIWEFSLINSEACKTQNSQSKSSRMGRARPYHYAQTQTTAQRYNNKTAECW